MTDSIYHFDHRPDPPECFGRWPAPPDWPKKAPDPEEHQCHAQYDEATLWDLGNQATHEASWGKNVVQAAEILLDGVRGLDSYQRYEGGIEPRHADGSRLAVELSAAAAAV